MTTPTPFRVAAVVRIAASVDVESDYQCYISDRWADGSKKCVSVLYSGIWFNVFFKSSGSAYRVTMDVASVDVLSDPHEMRKSGVFMLV